MHGVDEFLCRNCSIIFKCEAVALVARHTFGSPLCGGKFEMIFLLNFTGIERRARSKYKLTITLMSI